MSPACFMIVLAVAIATFSTSPVEGYTYYYYYYSNPSYYYYATPRQCSTNGNTYTYAKTCPVSSCYNTATWNSCCLSYFTYSNVLYKQCICGIQTTCAPTDPTYDGVLPDTTTTTTPSTTTSTTSTTTTTTPTTTTTTTPSTTTTTTPSTTTTTTPSTTTTTTPTTTTTTTPTTTTTTKPTTTTTKPNTTTTPKPTTTTPPTTTTTTTPTTTTTTPTTTTTTPAFRSLCDTGFRLLNGEAADECALNGIAQINILDGTLSTCNAVYAPATVNGVLQPTLITASVCKSIIEAGEEADTPSDIQIGLQTIPASLFDAVEGPNGLAYYTIKKRYRNLMLDIGCQKEACPFDPSSMAGMVNTSNCKISSWGVIDADSLMDSGLHEAPLSLNPGGCQDIPDLFGAANTQCYRTTSGKNLICARDTGAPVYCHAPSNGEWILMGVSSLQNDCDTSPEVKVIPHQG